MNNSEMSSLPKPPARFLVSAPKLKRLASQEMALGVCRQCARNDIDVCDDEFEWERFAEADPVTLEPEVPGVIPVLKEMVNDAFGDPIVDSLQRWFVYHKEKVFFDRENVYLNEVLVKCIDEFVLKPNGTVNYLETAKNLLISDAILSQVEKFRLACINCMADEIRNIWPLVRDHVLVVNYDYEQKHPLIHYWVRTMLGDVRRFPGGDANSLENCARIMKNMEWTAIQYFWNFLSYDEQVTFAGNLFEMKCSNNERTTPKLLMLNLTSEQLRLIITKEGSTRIINDLLLYFFDGWAGCGTSFFEVWHYLTYFIRQSEFPDTMAEFVKEAFRHGSESKCRLVEEIWNNTPIHLKRKMFSYECFLDAVFEALDAKNLNRISHWGYDMSFFVTLLTECSFQRRNEIWRRFWCNIIVGTAPSSLQRMMKLCFNNDDEIVDFKERHMMYFPDIHDFCRLSIVSGYVSKLNEYLNFCSTNEHYVATVKRQILASTDVQKAFLEGIIFLSFVAFDKFIDSAFFNERDARDYKRSLLLSSKKLQDIHAKVDRNEIGVSWI